MLLWDYIPHILIVPLCNALLLAGGCLEIVALRRGGGTAAYRHFRG
ncbi:hypothetical protein [Paenibacillus albidus]|nr:hypothetical protein [Paenibacillus albidus]